MQGGFKECNRQSISKRLRIRYLDEQKKSPVATSPLDFDRDDSLGSIQCAVGLAEHLVHAAAQGGQNRDRR
jgi:hypothetical protein